MDAGPSNRAADRTGWGDRLLIILLTAAFGAVLIKVSLLNNGLLLAPGVSAVGFVVVLALRRTVGPGQARSVLSGLAVGVFALSLLFGCALLVLLAGLQYRGE